MLGREHGKELGELFSFFLATVRRRLGPFLSNDVISPNYSSLRENRANTQNILQYQEITSLLHLLHSPFLCIFFRSLSDDVIKLQYLRAS